MISFADSSSGELVKLPIPEFLEEGLAEMPVRVQLYASTKLILLMVWLAKVCFVRSEFWSPRISLIVARLFFFEKEFRWKSKQPEPCQKVQLPIRFERDTITLNVCRLTKLKSHLIVLCPLSWYHFTKTRQKNSNLKDDYQKAIDPLCCIPVMRLDTIVNGCIPIGNDYVFEKTSCSTSTTASYSTIHAGIE